MDKMIVGINYTQDGERIIEFMKYVSARTESRIPNLAIYYESHYDEVYIVDFNPRCKEFIDEIVLKGCRV